MAIEQHAGASADMKVRINDYDQLAFLCHNRDRNQIIDGEIALGIYESEWRWIEWGELRQDEKDLIKALVMQYGNGVLRIKGPFSMRKPLRMRLADDAKRLGRPTPISEPTSVRDLCKKALIECVEDGGDEKNIALIDGVDHYVDMTCEPHFYSVGRDFIEKRMNPISPFESWRLWRIPSTKKPQESA